MSLPDDVSRYSDHAFHTLVHNPIVYSVFTASTANFEIAPGNPRFIATEALIDISTESGILLVTET